MLQWKARHSTRQCSGLPAASRRSVAAAVSAQHDDVEAVVLVDHGSKRAEANAMLEQFAEVYRFVVVCECSLPCKQRFWPVNYIVIADAAQGIIQSAAGQNSTHGAGRAIVG